MSRPENTTGPGRKQHLAESQTINFVDEFFDGNSTTVSGALSQASLLLNAAIAISEQIHDAEGPLDEAVTTGLLFLMRGSKALVDSTINPICRAAVQEEGYV